MKKTTFALLFFLSLSKAMALTQAPINYLAKIHFTFENELKDCKAAFTQVDRFFRVDPSELKSYPNILCRQQQISSDHYQIRDLKISFLVESLGTEESALALKKFINKNQDRELLGRPVHFFLVKSIEQSSTLTAKHSYQKIDKVLEAEFFTKASSAQELFLSSKNFFSDLNTQDEVSYNLFLKNKIRTQEMEDWKKLFKDPYVDELKFSTSMASFTVINEQNGEWSTIDDFPLLNVQAAHNTRWEFGEETSEDRQGEVCVNIDTQDNPSPFRAFSVEYPQVQVEIFSQKKACFPLKNTFYMGFFFANQGNNGVIYGTRCRYIPSKKHEGKTLHYLGENGEYKCLVD